MKHQSLPRTVRGIVVCVVGLTLVAGACSSDSKSDSTAAPTTTAAAATTAAAETTEAASATTEAATDTTEAATETTETASSETETTEATESSAAETTEPAATADKSPILIGAMIDQTGPSAGDGPTVPKVIQAWGDYINGNGGINGHPVEFDIRDTAGDAAKAQSETTDLAAKNPVLLLISSPGTESSQAEALKATGIPIMGVGYAPAIWGGDIEAFKLHCSTDAGAAVACALPNAFPVSTTFGAVVDEQVIGAQAAGATKLATAACAEVDSCSQAEPVFAADAAALGLTDTGVVKVSSTASDYTAECIKFVQDGVDFVQISAAGSVGAKMWSDCQDQGYTGIFGASAGTVSGDLIKVDGITLAGGIHGFPWWVDDAPVQQYRDAMDAAGVSADEYSSPTNTAMWSVLQLFAKANANMSDDPTKDETLAAMYTIKDETLDGLIPPITFTEGQLASARPCFWPYKLEGGEFSNPLGGLKYECYPPES